MSSLDRFKNAQDQRFAGFESALAELRGGRKTGHWIWYVFPQLAGLGMSEMSRAYGINGAAEATAYLRDPMLRQRLILATDAALEHLRHGVPITRLMGSSIDATKLVSSMTLFGAVAKQIPTEPQCAQLAAIADDVLAIANEAGYPACEFTRSRI